MHILKGNGIIGRAGEGEILRSHGLWLNDEGVFLSQNEHSQTSSINAYNYTSDPW